MLDPIIKIAGVMPLIKYNSPCNSFERLKALTDYTIILYNNNFCRTELDANEEIIIKSNSEWHDYSNHLTLYIRAYLNGCNWVLFLDADEDVDHRLTKEKLKKFIISQQQNNKNDITVINFIFCELWDDKYHYRSDGIWGKKKKPKLQKILPSHIRYPIDEEAMEKHRYHHFVKTSYGVSIDSPYHILHYAMLNKQDRLIRYFRWKNIDQFNFYQNGYEYFIDETSLELKELSKEIVDD